tara:strand:- start:143 stop:409 length:267 start_codon:yes stop_codon:yes gene_type:complete
MFVTHEGKRTNRSNLRHFKNGDYELLVSYATPVAFAINGLWHYTSWKYSSTTSKQITIFLNAKTGGRANALEVEQEEINTIARNFCYA